MRYYRLVFTGATENLGVPLEYSSISQGVFGNTNNTGALEIEFDILLALGSYINQGSTIRLRNVPIQYCKRAPVYNGLTLTLYAGFSDSVASGFSKLLPPDYGLPLAQGRVLACIPNYAGTEMTMDFVMVPPVYGSVDVEFTKIVKNYVFNWLPGQSIVDAVANTFHNLDKNIKVDGSVNPNIKIAHPVQCSFFDFNTFANFVQTYTQDIISPHNHNEYPGVFIGQIGNNHFVVYDSTYEGPSLIQLRQWDFIGQPSYYINNTTVSVQCTLPLRGDLALSKRVQFPVISARVPPTQLAWNSQKPLAISNDILTVYQIRHIGKFRSPDASQWSTLITCAGPGMLGPEQT